MVRKYSNRPRSNSFNYLVWVQWQSASIDPAKLFLFYGMPPICGDARTASHIAGINHVVWVAWKEDVWCCIRFVGANYSSKPQIQIEIHSFQSISKCLSSSPISPFLWQCAHILAHTYFARQSKQNCLVRTDRWWKEGGGQAAKRFNTFLVYLWNMTLGVGKWLAFASQLNTTKNGICKCVVCKWTRCKAYLNWNWCD